MSTPAFVSNCADLDLGTWPKEPIHNPLEFQKALELFSGDDAVHPAGASCGIKHGFRAGKKSYGLKVRPNGSCVTPNCKRKVANGDTCHTCAILANPRYPWCRFSHACKKKVATQQDKFCFKHKKWASNSKKRSAFNKLQKLTSVLPEFVHKVNVGDLVATTTNQSEKLHVVVERPCLDEWTGKFAMKVQTAKNGELIKEYVCAENLREAEESDWSAYNKDLEMTLDEFANSLDTLAAKVTKCESFFYLPGTPVKAIGLSTKNAKWNNKTAVVVEKTSSSSDGVQVKFDGCKMDFILHPKNLVIILSKHPLHKPN